jgi:hypothetical protein
LSGLQVTNWDKTRCQLYNASGLVDPDIFNALLQGCEFFLMRALMKNELDAGSPVYFGINQSGSRGIKG